jgi:hypothetical protein
MNTYRFSTTLLALLFCGPIPVCGGQAPAKASDAGMLPEAHGIAVFGGCSHHVDLFLALLAEDERRARTSSLRAELHVRAEAVPRLIQGTEKVFASLGKDKDGDATLKAMDECEEALLAHLPKAWSGKQQARFEELSCQLAGPMALRLKHYAALAGLSEGQRTGIKELVISYIDKAVPLHKAVFTARSEKEAVVPQRDLNAMSREMDKKILALLTEQQRARWQSLLGKRFDWKNLRTGE